MDLLKKKWVRRLLWAVVFLLILLLILPWPTRVEAQYEALLYQPEDFSQQQPVTVQVSGFYCRSLLREDAFFGTIHLMDYPRAGTNTGSRFDPLHLTRVNRNSTNSYMWSYSASGGDFDPLGAIFWDVDGERFLILHEDYQVIYPAKTEAEINDLVLELTTPD